MKYIYIFFFIAISQCVYSSDTLRVSPIRHQLEFNVEKGYVFQTTNFYKGLNLRMRAIDHSLSYHLKYAFRFSENSYYGRNYPGVYQGIGLSYNNFYNKKELGSPVALYLFQGAPIFTLSQSLTLDYEWNFGLSAGWKPYDEFRNPNNNVIGSRVNAYINLGLYFNWQLSRNIIFKVGGDVTHFSNGNTKYPNGGLNSVGLRGGFVYNFDAISRDNISKRSRAISFKPFWSYDLALYGAWRYKGIVEEHSLLPGSFAIGGFNFSPLYAFSRYFKAGFSLDGVYDESANLENYVAGKDSEDVLRVYRQPFNERISLGLSLRGEFVMPIFSINAGFGQDFLYRGDNSRGFYQVLALKTNISHNLYLHVGYQLNKFHIPKNLMIGLGYRFHNRK